MIYLEDLEVGETYNIKKKYNVTEDEIIEMGKRWDPRPFHIDPVAAKKSLLGGLVACSAHIFSIFSHLGYHTDEPIAAVSSLGFEKLNMHAPLIDGDEVSCSFTIVNSRLSKSRLECGIVTTLTELFNQHNKLVFSIQSTALILRRPGFDKITN